MLRTSLNANALTTLGYTKTRQSIYQPVNRFRRHETRKQLSGVIVYHEKLARRLKIMLKSAHREAVQY